MDFSDQRLSYEKGVLTKRHAPSNPFDLFKGWLQQAVDCNTPEPYAMSLATCGTDMLPSVRTVLLREVTASGIVFYTNYMSDKGKDIDENPLAECLFFWHDMQRQIRVRGTVNKIERSKTDSYFQKRPYESQIGAWTSQPQSGVVDSRDEIEELFTQFKAEYPDTQPVPTPEFWGGYEITISEIEFWQGRASRLHDRLLYQKSAETSQWHIERLLP